MQKAVIAKLDEKFLETTTADADRFVYCNYVMPLLVTADDDVTPILPGYKRGLLNAFAYNGIIDGAALKKALPALGFVDSLRSMGSHSTARRARRNRAMTSIAGEVVRRPARSKRPPCCSRWSAIPSRRATRFWPKRCA